MEKSIVSGKDLKRYEVLNQLLHREITGKQAGELLGYTEVHISRLKHKLIKYGFEGLLINRREPSHKTPESLTVKICNLYCEIYFDFNVVHFTEKLKDINHICLSRETVRQILIKNNILKPKKRKKVYRRRRRMPKTGMLIQQDSSEHKWLANIDELWHLTASIDDASNHLYFAELFPSDGVFNNMKAMKHIIRNYGIPRAFYVDKASHFTTTRLGGLHVDASIEQNNTNIEASLKDLDTTLIPANSPQAKGRIERSFRTFQDRFVKELRINGISDYQTANSFLENHFLPFYNKKFASSSPLDSDFSPLSPSVNIDIIFTKRFTRKVKPDNTIHVMGQKV